MSNIQGKISSGLETHREELSQMIDALDKVVLGGNRRAEIKEHMQRARQAVGLARAVLLEERE